MLADITPVILTLNEEPNIARTLANLAWARQVVVVDSGSTDGTVAVAERFPNVRVVARPFDTHAAQWNFATHETGIATEWVLALDADYQVTPELQRELAELRPPDEVVAYRIPVDYAIYGTVLTGSAYPPVIALFRPARATYTQDGHTQRLQVQGRCLPIRATIIHDDRKKMEHWFMSQVRYAARERDKLLEARASGAPLSLFDRLRLRRVMAPFAIAVYCLFAKGSVLTGRRGIFYTFQRVVAELMLSLFLLEVDFERDAGSVNPPAEPPVPARRT